MSEPTKDQLRARAKATYHDWRERCLRSGELTAISCISELEDAIADALKAEREATAKRCAEICESITDEHACDCKGISAAKIRAEFGITEKETTR